MGKSHFSAEQISRALRQVEPGAQQRSRAMREENAKFKRLVAGVTLDKVMLREVLAKKDWRRHRTIP